MEENNIPIDYIAGTSIGALIGAFYASGYSPDEIEKIFTSDQFKKWADGQLDEKYIYYLRKKHEDASWIRFKISTDTIWETNLPTNLVSPVSIDYGLMEYFAPPSAVSGYNFDSLFVPFRCVASDIISKKEVKFKDGDLATAVRASMAYPFYLKPITIDNMLLFDGGLYNNFPSDIMYDDFLPDYIIGSNVSSNYPLPDEDNLVSQIKTMLVNNTKYKIKCSDGVIIQPKVDDYPTFNFDNSEEIIRSGYEASQVYIDTILANTKRRTDKEDLATRRNSFRKSVPPLVFDNIEIKGLTDAQNKYVRKSLRYKLDTISSKKLRPEYIKVASDDKINQIYPKAHYNINTGLYDLGLKVKKDKDLFVSFGGNFSSRPINEGFVGLQYNTLGKTAFTFTANSYFGKFYSSLHGGVRLDFPFRIPFYWETNYTMNKWDYFKSSSTFFEDVKPSYLIIGNNFLESNLGFPIAYKGKIIFGGAYGRLKNEYYQTNNFISIDTADVTNFNNYTGFVQFERNALNRKQYATKGSYLSLKARFVQGDEEYIPGSTSFDTELFNNELEWLQFKFTYSKYFNQKENFRVGILTEGVYSNQPFFKNYTASILSAPAFMPIPESKTLFQDRFRAHSYFAGGLKTIFLPLKNFQFRVEGYFFQPYNEILKQQDLTAGYGADLSNRYFITSASTVYHTPLGPVALSLNYYDQTEQPLSFMFHFGYILFNKKELD